MDLILGGAFGVMSGFLFRERMRGDIVLNALLSDAKKGYKLIPPVSEQGNKILQDLKSGITAFFRVKLHAIDVPVPY